MFDNNARMLRDLFLAVALVIFAVGVLDILLLGFDLSLGTGLMLKMGFRPQSFAEGGIFFALASIAFGIIELSRSK